MNTWMKIGLIGSVITVAACSKTESTSVAPSASGSASVQVTGAKVAGPSPTGGGGAASAAVPAAGGSDCDAVAEKMASFGKAEDNTPAAKKFMVAICKDKMPEAARDCFLKAATKADAAKCK
jgi:formiminotetrahydrofolate cyclodeaminase